MDGRTGGAQALLGEAPRDHGAWAWEVIVKAQSPDLGDLIVALLASTLAGLRDRLACDGFADAAELVADLVDVTDGYLTEMENRRGESAQWN